MSTVAKKEITPTKVVKEKTESKKEKVAKKIIRVEDVFDAIMASKMEISSNKVKSLEEWASKYTAALAAIDKTIEKLRKLFVKNEDLKKLADYKAAVRTVDDGKTKKLIFHKMMEKIFALYGVHTPDTFLLDVTAAGKVQDRMAKILFVKKGDEDESDSD